MKASCGRICRVCACEWRDEGCVRKNRVRRRASGSGCEMAWWRPRRQRWRSEAKLRAESNAGLSLARVSKKAVKEAQRGSKGLPKGRCAEGRSSGSRERRAARARGAVRCGACMHARLPDLRDSSGMRVCVPLWAVLLKSWSRVTRTSRRGLDDGRRWKSDGTSWPSRCQSVESDMQVSTLAHEGRLFFSLFFLFLFFFFPFWWCGVRRGAGLKRAAAPAWSGCMIFWVRLIQSWEPRLRRQCLNLRLATAPYRKLRLTRLVAEGGRGRVGCCVAWRLECDGVRVAAAKVAAQVAGARWINAAVVAVEKDSRQQFGGLPIRCLALQPLRPLFANGS